MSPTAPELSTARLRLRGFRGDDLDAYAAICADPEVMRHIGAGGPIARDIAWRQMAMLAGEWPLRGYGQWAVERREGGGLIGRVGFLHPEGWPACELAWLLARDAWGQGLAVEAAGAALACGRERLGVPAELISMIRPGNHRSIRLAERLGAVADGTIQFLGDQALRYRHPPPR